MRCVVTGVAGFVGSSIADALLNAGHDVVGIDCFTDYYSREIKEANLSIARSFANFQFIESDLTSNRLEDLLDGAEVIFHQAAQAGVRASWGSTFKTYIDNNIFATQRLLEAAKMPTICRTLKKIVYASSSSVYGTAESLPTSEAIRPQPISPYGVTKLAAEHLMVLYAKEFNVPTVSLRYFTVYGPRQRPDMAFNRFIKAGLQKQSISVYGNGEQTRDFTYIDDIVAANIAAASLDASGLVINIGGGARVSVNHVLNLLSDLLGVKLIVEYLDKQVGDALHTGADITFAKNTLNYSPRVSLRDGLQREVEWLGRISS